MRLLKHGSDKPLGFYIRDGTSVRVTPAGLEKAWTILGYGQNTKRSRSVQSIILKSLFQVPGIFISRLVPGGLAESTGLLAVNDEGKSDQILYKFCQFWFVSDQILCKFYQLWICKSGQILYKFYQISLQKYCSLFSPRGQRHRGRRQEPRSSHGYDGRQ